MALLEFEILNQWKHLEKDEKEILTAIINNDLHEADAQRWLLRMVIRCADLRRRMAERKE